MTHQAEQTPSADNSHLYDVIRDLGRQLRAERARADQAEAQLHDRKTR